MAVITEMLGEKVISGFKGTLDYYYYMGIACVRSWPRSPGHARSPQVEAGWQPFTAAVLLWNTTPQYLRASYKAMASATALSGRDISIRAYMSGLNRLYEHPTSLPPPAERQHFAVTSWWKVLTVTGFIIYCTTNVPCHLTMRWTPIEPQKHIDPVLRRGLYMHGDPRFCFVAYHDNEQVGVGDTLIHQFDKPDWPECQTRSFYFWGTIGGELSPSTSPILDLHFGVLITDKPPWDLHHVQVNKDFVQYAFFKSPSGHHPDHLRIKLGRVGEPGDFTLSVHRLLASGYPNPTPLASDTKVITGIPPIPFADWFTFQLPTAAIGKDGWYALKGACSSTLPVTVRWFGYPNINDPDSYWVQYRADINRWYFYYPTRLNYLIRGRLIT